MAEHDTLWGELGATDVRLAVGGAWSLASRPLSDFSPDEIAVKQVVPGLPAVTWVPNQNSG